MLYDCPDCGEAYAAEGFSVTLCPRCDSENVASFDRPINAPKSNRRGAWAAGLSAALIIMGMAVLSWSTFDLDGDGMSTYQEWQQGTEPFNPDSDGDGLLDGWELDNGFDPTKLDSDGDGRSDLTEVREQAVSNPQLCVDLPLDVVPCAEPAKQPDQPASADSVAANASATRVTAWYAVASVALAAAVGIVAGRTMLRD